MSERSGVEWLLSKPSHGSHRALSRLFLRCFALTSQKTRGRWGAPYLSQGSYMGEATERWCTGVINALGFLGKRLHWKEQDYKPFVEPIPESCACGSVQPTARWSIEASATHPCCSSPAVLWSSSADRPFCDHQAASHLARLLCCLASCQLHYSKWAREGWDGSVGTGAYHQV